MGEVVKAGTWVEVKNILLTPDQRAPQVPDDTKKTPYIMKVDGFLCQDAEIGSQVEIETLAGRKLSGTLEVVRPCYSHSFGETVEELLRIGLGGKS
jgi:hypothetical protein